MNIVSVRYENNMYTVTYKKENKTYHTVVELSFGNDIIDASMTRDILNDIMDAFYISADEYIIIYPKLYECLPEDTTFSIGIARYYIQTHYNGELLLECAVKITDDLNFNTEEFKNSLFHFYGWR